VLVHFSEVKASNLTPPSELAQLVFFVHGQLKSSSATTPWIAMIPCDSNSSTASMDEDVFTLARDKGAKAAVSTKFLVFFSLLNPMKRIISSYTRNIR
jgi:hypothetical protein